MTLTGAGTYEKETTGRANGPEARALRKDLLGARSHDRDDGPAPRRGSCSPTSSSALSLGQPGADPGGDRGTAIGTGALPGLASQVLLGADRGYTQCRPEHFHLPVRALGYSLVMDYKAAETSAGRPTARER